MQHDFGVTIVSDLATSDVRGADVFPHTHVIDLRYNPNACARPCDETTWKRMRSYFVEYDQMPVNLQNPSSRQENALLRQITEQGGNVLIVTEQVVAMAHFCQDFDIPHSSPELAVFETATGTLPVKLARTGKGSLRLVTEQFESLAG